MQILNCIPLRGNFTDGTGHQLDRYAHIAQLRQKYVELAETNERLAANPPTSQPWEAFNMAVYGYSALEGLKLFQTRGQQLAADVVTIYYGWNDHWLSIGADPGNQSMGVMRAQFTNADLTGADLTGANLFKADFSFATLTGAKLAGELVLVRRARHGEGGEAGRFGELQRQVPSSAFRNANDFSILTR